jgi:hypothetical protein
VLPPVPRPSAIREHTPGAAGSLSPLDALMAKHAAKATNRDQPTSGVTIAPQGSGISPDNPFGDLIPQKPSAGLFDDLIPASGQAELRFAPTSGVTIAPKNALRVRLQQRNRGRLVQAPLGPMSPGRLRTIFSRALSASVPTC